MHKAGDYWREAEEIGGPVPGPAPAFTLVCCAMAGATREALAATLASVRAQTRTDWELVVVGEGLGLEAADEIRAAARAEPRLRGRLHAAGPGLPALRVNEGLAGARGEWIAYLRPGVVWNPSALEELSRGLAPGEDALVVADLAADGRPGGRRWGAPAHFSALVDANPIAAAGVLHSRRLLERAGGYDPHLYLQRHWEWDFWLRCGRLVTFRALSRLIGTWGGEAPAEERTSAGALFESAFRLACERDRLARLRPDAAAACALDEPEPWGPMPRKLREGLRAYVVLPWRLGRRPLHGETGVPAHLAPEPPGLAAVVSGVHNCTFEVTIGNLQPALAAAERRPWTFDFWPLSGNPAQRLRLADLLLLHRTYEPAALETLRAAQRTDRPVLFMTDDDILGLWEQFEEYAFLAPGRPLRASLESQLTEADAVVLFSDGAESAYRRFNPRTMVRPVTVPEGRLHAAFSAAPPGAPFRIGFVGSSGRGPEMAFLLPVLEELSREFGDRMELVFWGLDLGQAKGLQCRYEFLPYSHSYREYLDRLLATHFDLLLAPLFDEPRARRAKTFIKYLETTAAGTVGIYSDVPPYAAVRSPECGLKVSNTADAWRDGLRRLLRMPAAEREAIWRRAREDVVRHHTAEVQSDAHLSALHAGVLHGRTRRRRHADGRPRFAYLFHSLTYAGSESFLCRHATIARDHGFEPVFVAPEPTEHRAGGLRDFALNHRIALHFLPLHAYPHPASPPDDVLRREADRLKEWLGRERIAMIHSANYIPAAGLAAHETGTPHVASIYQPYDYDPAQFAPKPYPHAQALIGDSLMYASFWEDLLDVPAYCLRSPIPDAFFLVGEERAPAPPGERPPVRIAIVGALHERKGQLRALRALERLGDLPGRIELTLAGLTGYFPIYEERCRRVIEKIHRQNGRQVIFGGFYPDVPALLARTDVLLVASETESFPQVVLEAMAARALVATTPVAGVPELVLDGWTGLVAGGFDEGALTELLRRAATLGAAAQEAILARAWQTVTQVARRQTVSEQLLWVYRQAFERAAAPAAGAHPAAPAPPQEWEALACPYGMKSGISYPMRRARVYEIHADRAGLCGLRIRIGTHGRRLEGPLELTVRAAGTAPCTCAYRPETYLQDPIWAEFSFPPLPKPADGIVRLRFARPAGAAAQPVSFFQFEPVRGGVRRKLQKRLWNRPAVPQVQLRFGEIQPP